MSISRLCQILSLTIEPPSGTWLATNLWNSTPVNMQKAIASQSSQPPHCLSDMTPFHLAFPISDIQQARHFYGKVLGCPEGRSAETWVDFNLYGHQIVAHYQAKSTEPSSLNYSNLVDSKDIPVPHFGVVLSMEEWKVLRDRLKAAKMQFRVEPYIRFEGQAGEQATMFILDPFGNALEFEAFKDISNLFKK